MRTAGLVGSENAGMSSARWVRIPSTVCLRVPGEGSSSQGKSGPKVRLKSVVERTTGLYSCTTYITEGVTKEASESWLMDSSLSVKAST